MKLYRNAALVITGWVLYGTPDLQAQTAAPRIPGDVAPASRVATRNAVRFLTPVACETIPPQRRPDSKQAPPTTDDEFGLKLPTQDRLFQLESEQAFRERLRQELPKVKNVQFPRDIPFVPEGQTTEVLKHGTVGPVLAPICYRPLYFEDKRSERLGKYVPYLQPLVSTSKFYADVLMLPYRLIATPPWTFECDNR